MRSPSPALLALALLSCAPDSTSPSPDPPAPSAPPSRALELPACARRAAHAVFQPMSASGEGSPVALVRAGDRSIALVADEDSAAIHAVDVDARAVLATTKLPGKPAQIVITPDGRVVAALRDPAMLVMLEPGDDVAAPLTERCRVETPAEPVALALTPDGSTLLAPSRWGHALSAFATADLAPRFTVDLPRDPAAVAVSADGSRAFVTHLAGGRMSVIDLGAEASRAPRTIGLRSDLRVPVPAGSATSCLPGTNIRASFNLHERPAGQAFALVRAADGRLFAPVVVVEPRPAVTAMSLYAGNTNQIQSAASDLAVVDPGSEQIALGPQGPLVAGPCLLPRAAAVDEDRGELLVACLGRDEIVAYDTRADIPRARAAHRWKVAPGPRGVAVDRRRARAVVWSQFDGVLDVIALDDPAAAPIAVPIAAHQALPPTLDRGRKLFHDAGGSRISFDGRACASCHVDGRDDGVSWWSLQGIRQTPMLLGRLQGTAPYGWGGDDADLPHHFVRTLGRLGGHGISAGERDAIFAWLASLAPPAEPPRPADPLLTRGEAIFESKEAGCSSCHLGDETTDHASHDVKTGIASWAGGFDTPSLRFLSRSAPYLHDGRYATIPELLEKMDGKMGHTKQLSPEDRAALAAYVESL